MRSIIRSVQRACVKVGGQEHLGEQQEEVQMWGNLLRSRVHSLGAGLGRGP